MRSSITLLSRISMIEYWRSAIGSPSWDEETIKQRVHGTSVDAVGNDDAFVLCAKDVPRDYLARLGEIELRAFVVAFAIIPDHSCLQRGV